MDISIIKRFNAKLSLPTENGCIEWNAALSKKGYGVICIGSRIGNTRKIVYAHRISYEINYVKIKNGLHVLHKCDNPKCVNHKHLFLGTAKDNMRDMHNKNRAAMKKGIVPNNFIEQVRKIKNKEYSKLNNDQVKKIKNLLMNNINCNEIAQIYNVSRCCISDIKRNSTWKEVLP